MKNKFYTDRMSLILVGAGMVLGYFFSSKAFSDQGTGAIQSAMTQQKEVRDKTQAAANEIKFLIEEYKRNGLGGEEVKVLEAIHSVLGSINQKDMGKILDLLKQLHGGGTVKPQGLNGVIGTQRDIVVQMRKLYLDYERQKAASELPLRLSQLAERQAANLKSLRQSMELRKKVGDLKGKKGSSGAEEARLKEWEENLKSDEQGMEIQVSEQDALKKEISHLAEKINSIGKDSVPEMKEKMEEVIKALKDPSFLAALDLAVSDLKGVKLDSAQKSEKKILDGLKDSASALLPPKDPLEAMRELAQRLDQLIQDQGKVIEDTRRAEDYYLAAQDDPVYMYNRAMEKTKGKEKAKIKPLTAEDKVLSEKVLAARERVKAALKGSKISASDLGIKVCEPLIKTAQEGVQSGAEALQVDVKAVSADAGAEMGLATGKMGEVVQLILSNMVNLKNPKIPLPLEQGALSHLEKAKVLLQGQIAEAEKSQNMTDAEKLAQLQALKGEVDRLANEQANLEKAAGDSTSKDGLQKSAPKQEGLEDQTNKLQAAMAAQSPEASKSLGKAASQMQQSADAMKSSDKSQMKEASKNAVAALNEASKGLAQEIQKAEQSMLNASELQSAMNQLDQAEQSANQAMNQMQPGKSTQEAQNSLQKAAAALKQAEQGMLPTSAKEALEQAKQALNAAASNLNSNNKAEARKKGGQGQKAIAEAKNAIASALGNQPPPGSMPSNMMGIGGPGPGKPGGLGNELQMITDAGSAASQDEVAPDPEKGSNFIVLPEEERMAIEQAAAEKYPQDYAVMIEQYFKNLSGQGK